MMYVNILEESKGALRPHLQRLHENRFDDKEDFVQSISELEDGAFVQWPLGRTRSHRERFELFYGRAME
jgi:hypothetical protein